MSMDGVKELSSGDELDGFIDVIGKISTVVGFGQQLADIFGGSAPLTIGDIKAAIQQEVTAALLAQTIETEIVNASATLQSVQDFIAIQYLNQVNGGADPATLYALLNGSTLGPLVADMMTNVEALKLWMDNLDDSYQSNPSGNLSNLKLAATGFSVSLGTYLYLSIVYREMAKQAATESDRRIQLTNMRKYARLGVQRIGPSLTNVVNVRLASLIYLSNDNPNVTDVGGIPIKQYCTIDSLNDAWFDTWVFAFKAYNDSTMDYAAALHWVERASRNLLWSGAQADADDFSRSLTDGWLRVPQVLGQGDTAWADNFRNTCLAPNTAFGQWVLNTRTALIGLDAIAFGYLGTEQDNWSWCSSCGGLYYAGAPSRCPAANGGPHAHVQWPSSNYVLRCDPVDPAPRPMSDDWRWCRKCSGLFKNSGPRVCPAGAEHDPSGSGVYQLDVGPVPDATVLGLTDPQDNWRMCGKCSGLHYGADESVCPAGGAHDSSDGENKWLSRLGMLPQPS
jgi:hypothetical protein